MKPVSNLNTLKEAEVKKKSLTKAEIYDIIRTYTEELSSLSYRKQHNEENFALPAWAEYQAFQLGYQKALDKILEFVPNLDQRKSN